MIAALIGFAAIASSILELLLMRVSIFKYPFSLKKIQTKTVLAIHVAVITSFVGNDFGTIELSPTGTIDLLYGMY